MVDGGQAKKSWFSLGMSCWVVLRQLTQAKVGSVEALISLICDDGGGRAQSTGFHKKAG